MISIVIPVCNERRALAAVLDELRAQHYPAERYEIVVADGNSSDGTAELVEEAARSSRVPRITRVHNPAQLSSAGRNAGVRHSRGELVVFVDAHCKIANPSFLSATEELFLRTGADCLCRPQPLEVETNTLFQQVVAHARASAFGHGRDSRIYATDVEGFINPTSSGASYRREVFAKVGMYDESFDACEDVEFNHRVHKAGLRAFTSPRVMVRYAPRSTFRGLWKQMVRYGRGRFRLASKHADARSAAQLVPAALLAAILAGPVLAAAWNPARIALAALIAAWGAAAVVSSLVLARRHGWQHAFVAPLVYATIHLGLGAGWWAECLAVASPRPHVSVPAKAQ